MTRIICISSGKGGVGKTMITANLGTALAGMGKDVVVLDANLTTPNLGIHLGIPLYPVTLQDVLKGTADIEDAIYEHDNGLKVIPSGISLNDMKGTDSRDLSSAILKLLGRTDVVLMDCAAGLGREALSAIESSDELIVVTNPDVSSVTDALKTLRLANEIGTKTLGIVINRVSGRRHELTTEEVLTMLGDIEVLAEIPEDINVQKSISKRRPVVQRKPSSDASQEIKKLAHRIVGQDYNYRRSWYRKFFGFVIR